MMTTIMTMTMPVVTGDWHIIPTRLQVDCFDLPILTNRDLRRAMMMRFIMIMMFMMFIMIFFYLLDDIHFRNTSTKTFRTLCFGIMES